MASSSSRRGLRSQAGVGKPGARGCDGRKRSARPTPLPSCLRTRPAAFDKACFACRSSLESSEGFREEEEAQWEGLGDDDDVVDQAPADFTYYEEENDWDEPLVPDEDSEAGEADGLGLSADRVGGESILSSKWH